MEYFGYKVYIILTIFFQSAMSFLLLFVHSEEIEQEKLDRCRCIQTQHCKE